MKKSPLAPKNPDQLPMIEGVSMQSYNAAIAYGNRNDVLFMLFEEGTQVAGTVTQSKTRSASVEACVDALETGFDGRALLVNSGNSNAFTGKSGAKTVAELRNHIASKYDVKIDEIYTSSTGVIGEVLSSSNIIEQLNRGLALDGDFMGAAEAIMTTDTFSKYGTKTIEINGVSVTINAIAKGSGMIAPNMATMLSYVVTDAKIDKTLLQSLLSDAVQKSFNSITVDSDTSTSDTVLCFATQKAEHDLLTKIDQEGVTEFKTALEALCLDMAQQIVMDGEGASKFIEVAVTGAEDDKAAHNIGLSIANSPLVKTAIAGEDANWGRIVMAVGKSGEKADRDLLAISIGGIKITDNGEVVPNYDEAPVAQHMKNDRILIEVDLGLGNGVAKIYTCDLTHGYIEINADYRS